MKKILLLIAFVIAGTFTFAQSGQELAVNSGDAFTRMSNTNKGTFGASTLFYNPKRRTDGTVYLFENWDNTGVIHTSDGQKFLIRNINLNIERHTFESRVSRDTLFTFNFNNIERFTINGRNFKNYYWDDDNKVYEIVYDNGDFQILKGFRVLLVEGSANPMLNRSVDKYVRKEYYYIRKDDKIKVFKLKKNKILKLVDGDEAKAEKIEEYAKNNNLSFKREGDVKKILEYSAKN